MISKQTDHTQVGCNTSRSARGTVGSVPAAYKLCINAKNIDANYLRFRI